MVKRAKKAKAKKATVKKYYIVVWDEGSGDPAKVFDTLQDAKKLIEELIDEDRVDEKDIEMFVSSEKYTIKSLIELARA